MTLEQPQLTGMGAEPGYESEQDVEPARVSGFVSLILGLVSAFAFMGTPLLLFPVLALVSGMFALRRCEGKPPLGTTAAKIGLILAVGFGVFGASLPLLKIKTVGDQAKEYSLEYLNLIANENYMLARELRKNPLGRLPSTISLQDFYDSNENAGAMLRIFAISPLNVAIRDIGPDADWQLARPVQVDYHFGREQVEVVWSDPAGEVDVQFFLELQFDPNGVGQWHVATVQELRERVVAEKVL
jgi:hypothetical protein